MVEKIISFIFALVFVAAGFILGLPGEYIPLALFALASFLLYPYRENNNLFWLSFYVTLFYGIYVFKTILTPFLLALWLAFLVEPVVAYLEKKKIPRWISSLLIILLLFVFILAFVTQAGIQVIKSAPVFYKNVQSLLLGFFNKLKHMTFFGQNAMLMKDKIYPILNNMFLNLSRNLVNVSYSALSFAGSLLFLLLTFIITFYVLVDYDKVARLVDSFLNFGGFTKKELEFIGSRLRRYLRGQLIEATIIGVLTTIGLGLLGIDFYIFLGILAGVMNLIPTLGFWLSYIPALFVGFGSGNWIGGALKVTVVFMSIQAMETAFISPRVLGGSVGIHPMIILLGLLVFGKLFGTAGVIIAVPTIAIVQGILKYRNKGQN